jgi:hypothetical protein
LPEGQPAPDPEGIWYPELRLQQLIRLFYNEINVEDLICLMANIYPNKPILEKTLFFDLLQYYTFSESDLELLRVHFRCSTDYLGWAPKEN